MTDVEIFVKEIAKIRMAQIDLVLEAARQELIRGHASEENGFCVRTLKPGIMQGSAYSATRFIRGAKIAVL